MASEDKVGYGNPPKHTQFHKGQSGNPKGRPRGTRNLETDLREELDEPIVVREGGRKIEISKQRAFVKSLVSKALQGEARAVSSLIAVMARYLDVDGSSTPRDMPTTAEEEAVLEVLKNRVLERAKRRGGAVSGGENGGET